MNKLTDSFVLSNGVQVPCIGYGTYLTPDGEVAKNSVLEALKVGYRHLDTAFAYGNEVAVGEGIKASGIKRDDVFVTTKHWVTMRGYEKAMEAIDISLKNLGLDYLDLYLIHWPCVEKVSSDWKEINASTWKAFEDAYKAGKIRAIGVSNFQKKHYNLGLYREKNEAIRARCLAEEKLHDPVILEYWDSLTEERKKEFQDYLRNTKK